MTDAEAPARTPEEIALDEEIADKNAIEALSDALAYYDSRWIRQDDWRPAGVFPTLTIGHLRRVARIVAKL